MISNDELAQIKNEVAKIGAKSTYGLNVKEFVDKVIFETLNKDKKNRD